MQTSFLVSATPPARTEPLALTMAMVDTDVHVLLATLGPTVRPTSMTAAQIPATMEGPAL